MKNKKYFPVILSLTLVLSACAGSSGQIVAQDTTASVTSSEEVTTVTEEMTTEIPTTTEEQIATQDDADLTRKEEKGTVMVNQYGHRPNDQKLVVVKTNVETSFSVINASTGNSVYEGELMDIVSGSDIAGNYKVGSFTQVVDEGNYYISCGVGDSGAFIIREDIYDRMYQDMLKSVKSLRQSPDETTDMNGYLISESKILSDLLSIYDIQEKQEDIGEDVKWHIDALMKLGEDEVLKGKSSCTERALYLYSACLMKGARVLSDNEDFSCDEIKDRALKVWNSLIGESDISEISVNAESKDAFYYAAVEMYMAGEISDGELSDIDISEMNGGLDENDMSGYGMFGLIYREDGGASADISKKRLTEIIKTKADSAEEKYFSAAFYEGTERPDIKDISEQGMFFLLSGKISDDERIPVLAGRQLDYMLGENDEGICYIKKYGYHTIEKEQDGTVNTSLLYLLSALTSEDENVEEE